MKHSYKQIDEEIIGGHHVHENEYVVEKIPIYITSFDVIDTLGDIDGFAVLSENNSHCNECLKIIDDEKEYCEKCKNELNIKQIQNNNHQLDSF